MTTLAIGGCRLAGASSRLFSRQWSPGCSGCHLITASGCRHLTVSHNMSVFAGSSSIGHHSRSLFLHSIPANMVSRRFSTLRRKQSVLSDSRCVSRWCVGRALNKLPSPVSSSCTTARPETVGLSPAVAFGCVSSRISRQSSPQAALCRHVHATAPRALLLHIGDVRDFEQRVIMSAMPVVVNFYADWCEPCHDLTAILEQLISDRRNIALCTLNAEENKSLLEVFDVHAVPAVLAFFNGQVVDKFVGLVNRTMVVEFVARIVARLRAHTRLQQQLCDMDEMELPVLDSEHASQPPQPLDSSPSSAAQKDDHSHTSNS